MTDSVSPPGLFDRPVLVIDPGFHTAVIKCADVDAAGRLAVTGSYDKTVRVWSLVDGAFLRVIRLPQGPGNIGKVSAVSLRPDGEFIAAGGWAAENQGHICLFSAVSGMLRQRISGLPTVAIHLAFSPDG